MAGLLDFVVIGAPRSGTTWLYQQLALHPDVFLPENKEPRFFAVPEGFAPAFTGPGDDIWASGLVTTLAAYEELFANAGSLTCGEASTDYLYRGGDAAPKLRELAPDVRIVAILRNPVERAHSAWRLLVHSGHETLTFEEGLAAEEQRIADGWAWWWHYSQHGFYARNLKPWLDIFPAEQLLVLPYDDIESAPQSVLDRVTSHIGLSSFAGSALETRVNEAALTRSVRRSASRSPLRALLKAAIPARAWRTIRGAVDHATLYKPEVADQARAQLEHAYRDDLAKLEELLGEAFRLER